MRHRALLEQALYPLKIQPRHFLLVLEAFSRRLRRFDFLRPAAVHRLLKQRLAGGEPRPGGYQRGLRSVQGCLGNGRVQPKDQSAFADEQPLMHGHLDHPAVDLRRNVHQMARKTGVVRVHDAPHEKEPVDEHAGRHGSHDADPEPEPLAVALAVATEPGVAGVHGWFRRSLWLRR